jgi:hypothetical protein
VAVGLRFGGDHGYHLGWLAGVEYEEGLKRPCWGRRRTSW